MGGDRFLDVGVRIFKYLFNDFYVFLKYVLRLFFENDEVSGMVSLKNMWKCVVIFEGDERGLMLF